MHFRGPKLEKNDSITLTYAQNDLHNQGNSVYIWRPTWITDESRETKRISKLPISNVAIMQSNGKSFIAGNTKWYNHFEDSWTVSYKAYTQP